MIIESRKLHLIEEMIKLKSEKTLTKIERILKNYRAIERCSCPSIRT